MSSSSFAVQVYGSASCFSKPLRGVRQGCPMLPLLFIIVPKGLSRLIGVMKRGGTLRGVKMGRYIFLVHLLLVDDVLLFGAGSIREGEVLKALDLYSKATGMEINMQKSYISFSEMSHRWTNDILQVAGSFFSKTGG